MKGLILYFKNMTKNNVIFMMFTLILLSITCLLACLNLDISDIINKSNILPYLSFIGTEYNNFVEMYFSYLDTLSMGEEALFLNIIFDIVMLLTALNITSVFFGNELIKYLEIEKRFPKLSKVMRLRTIYQRYYLAWSMFIFIIANLLSIFLCVTGFILNK